MFFKYISLEVRGMRFLCVLVNWPWKVLRFVETPWSPVPQVGDGNAKAPWRLPVAVCNEDGSRIKPFVINDNF